MVQNHVKERIIDVLKQHPEGLTVVDISKILGSHRHTIAKYIYQLVDEDLIYQREVGTAKLCYLKGEKNDKK